MGGGIAVEEGTTIGVEGEALIVLPQALIINDKTINTNELRLDFFIMEFS